MKKQNEGIIVLGGHVNGLGIIRTFGKNNIPSILIDKTKHNLGRHSKYCKKFYHCKTDATLDLLKSFDSKGIYKNWMLMPTSDSHVEILSKNYDQLSKHFKVSVDKWENVEKFYNKRITYRMIDKLDIDYPTTWMPDSLDELLKMNISYPCIIKPAIMHTFYSKIKKKVLLCSNLDELKKNYELAIELIPNNKIIIQDIINGPNENQYSVCLMNDGKKALVQFVARRTRQHPLDFGNATTFAETIENDGLLESAKKIVQHIGYKGLCEVEFKQDAKDGKFKFLEVNPRTWKWHYLSTKSNSPFLMSLYHHKHGLKEIKALKWDKAFWKHITTDSAMILQMRKKGLGIVKPKSLPIFAVWDNVDPMPFIWEIIYLPYLIMTR